MVDGVWADTEEEADKQIEQLLERLEKVKTKFDLQGVDWKLEPTIVDPTEYHNDLPKDELGDTHE
jgi:hypothetical protein